MQKERILSTLRMRGPSLPVQIARVLDVSPLFASAFLSELKAEDKVKISNMRVGSSPLYFIPGQENLLENFTKYLNSREREAYELLKISGVLEDDLQLPVVRVALRAIKDFAYSIKVRINGDSKLFWKHFLVDDSEVGKIISGRFSVEKKNVESEKVEKFVEDAIVSENSVVSEVVEKAVVSEKSVVEEVKIPVVKKQKETEFGNLVRDYLTGRDVELMNVFVEKKKEFEGRVRIDTLFGKQEYFFIAKDKKSATDNDFIMGLQKAQGLKLPALVMISGDLNKKAKEHLKEWGNLVKWERLKLC